MKTWMSRRAVLPAAALVALGALLTGCSGGEEQAPPTSPTSPAAVEVSDADLGKAMEVLVFHGTSEKSNDGGLCFARAVKDGGVSPEGQAFLVESVSNGSDDLAALVDGMWETNAPDASILGSPELGGDLENCVTQQSGPQPSDGGGDETKGSEDKVYESPKDPEPEAAQKPNLTPTYPLHEDEKVRSASDLTDGLVVVFSSYAQDEQQKKVYEAAGECFSQVVFDAGFSQETLRFLAEGPPLGEGSVSDHLPSDEDKALWESQEFSAQLMNCQLDASSTITAGGDQDEETAET